MQQSIPQEEDGDEEEGSDTDNNRLNADQDEPLENEPDRSSQEIMEIEEAENFKPAKKRGKGMIKMHRRAEGDDEAVNEPKAPPRKQPSRKLTNKIVV